MNNFTKSGLDHTNARTTDQKKLMDKIEKDGVCPFCAEHFVTYHPKPILKETEAWFVTTNMSPYEGTTHHFLFVYKPCHITKLSEISHEESADLFSVVAWVTTTYAIKGGSFFMRFGEKGFNGSSVEHLHAHLIVGEQASEGTEALRIKLGYKKQTQLQ